MKDFHSGGERHFYTGDPIFTWTYHLTKRLKGKFVGTRATGRPRYRPEILCEGVDMDLSRLDIEEFERRIVCLWDDEDWANQKDLYEWIKSHTGQTFSKPSMDFPSLMEVVTCAKTTKLYGLGYKVIGFIWLFMEERVLKIFR